MNFARQRQPGGSGRRSSLFERVRRVRRVCAGAVFGLLAALLVPQVLPGCNVFQRDNSILVEFDSKLMDPSLIRDPDAPIHPYQGIFIIINMLEGSP